MSSEESELYAGANEECCKFYHLIFITSNLVLDGDLGQNLKISQEPVNKWRWLTDLLILG